MMISAQVSHSYIVPGEACVKNCVANVCMKASNKATPSTCDDPCKKMCDPLSGAQYIVPRGGRNPVKAFCKTFTWMCQ
ncbi:unnamed protein product [Thlaspi arvense]|uniref:Uncharacterized protein n=1 Tax=Thlaspi arvense TaxID=13288 RepID=A0AAU9R4A4_THLAR|nr:unnamed protein product [Thlaspi arvense]